MSDITTSSTYSVGTKSYSNNGLSSLVSGMDTDSMVKKLLSGTQTKIDKQGQAKQVLEWKQDMYRDIITSINKFQSTYFDTSFDSTLKTNLASSDFFNTMASTSSSGAVKITGASSDALTGDMSVQVTQLAKAASITNSGLTSSSDVTSTIALTDSDLLKNFEARTVNIKVGDDTTGTTIDLAGIANTTDLVNKLNDSLSAKNVTVKLTNTGTLSFTSATNEKIDISGTDYGLSTLGLSSETTSKDVTESSSTTSNGTTTTSSTTTQVLTAATSPNTAAKMSFSITMNGVTKQIDVDPTTDGNGTQTITADAVKKALAQSIAKAYGGTVDTDYNVTGGYLNLTMNADSTFTLTASDLASSTTNGNKMASQFTITGASSSKLGITPGTSNRLSTDATLDAITNHKDGTTTSTGYTSTNTYAFTINGHDFSFKGDVSLYTVMNAVNNSNCGATMSYSSLSDTFKLESNSTGSGYSLTTNEDSSQNSGKNDLLATLLGGNSVVQGQDAKATVVSNGVSTDIVRSSNSITVDGVSMELTKVSDTAATISTSRDTDSIVKTVKQFVEDYNTLITALRDKTDEDATYKDYAPLTDEQKEDMKDSEITAWTEKAKTGLLRNDESITSFLDSMRSALYTKPANSNFALYDIGIETESYSSGDSSIGTLTFDETAFRKALADDPQSVTNLFTDSQSGIAYQLSKICDSTAKVSLTSPGSLVQIAGVSTKSWSAKNNDIYNQIKDIDNKITDLKEKYDDEKTRYWDEFNNMETALSTYSSQSSWLTSQFSS